MILHEDAQNPHGVIVTSKASVNCRENFSLRRIRKLTVHCVAMWIECRSAQSTATCSLQVLEKKEVAYNSDNVGVQRSCYVNRHPRLPFDKEKP